MKLNPWCCELLLATTMLAGAAEAFAAGPTALICTVDNSDDRFAVYPEQRVFESASFTYYQLMNGLTLYVVNRQTGRFNRISNLNLLAQSTLDPQWGPEPVQMFSGQCRPFDVD